MKRRFIDAPTELRCKADVPVRGDESGAQCGRYAKVDGLCRQHERMRHAKSCAVNFVIAGKEKPCDCGLDPNFDPTAALKAT